MNILQRAAFVCLTTAWVNQVAAAPVVNSTVSLTELSFSLVDLDPNDGIAPSILFTDGRYQAGASDDYYAGTQFQQATGSVFSVVSGQASSMRSLALFGNGTLSASSLVDSEQTTDVISRAPSDGAERVPVVFTSSTASNYYGSDADLPPYVLQHTSPEVFPMSSFTLTANTQLVVKGKVNFDLHANLAPLDSSELLTAARQGRLEAEFATGGSAEFYLLDQEGNPVDAFGMGEWAGQVVNRSGVVNISSLGTDLDNYTETFELSFMNQTPDAKSGGIWANVMSSSVLALSPQALPAPTTLRISSFSRQLQAVPEPSTYALMGLGLVGLSVVARQRRARQPH
jgi:PEP-CTERM motif